MSAWGGRGTGAMGRRDPYLQFRHPPGDWRGDPGYADHEPLALPAPVWRPVHPVR